MLRSDPKGVTFMLRYPSIADDPGFEAWHAPDVPGKDTDEIPWKCKKTFGDIQKWSYAGCSVKVKKAKVIHIYVQYIYMYVCIYVYIYSNIYSMYIRL